MFRCSSKDNKTTLVSIQGSYSFGGSNPIAGMVFQNYDDHSHKIYDMAEIYIVDGSSNAEFDGFSDLVFSTKAGISNEMSEVMRINYEKNVGIGTTEPIEKLQINDGNIFITTQSNQGFIINNQIGLFDEGINYSNIEFKITKINEGTLQNPISIDDILTINLNNDIILSKNLIVTDSISTSNLLNVKGITTLQDDLFVLGSCTISETLNVTDSIATSNLLNVKGITTLQSNLNLATFIDMSNITKPTIPIESNIRLYHNKDTGFLEGLDNFNVLSTFNPTTTIGDISLHNGITQERLPVGTINQILYSDPLLTNKLGWKDIASDTQAIDPNITKYFDYYNSNIVLLNPTTYSDVIIDSERYYDKDYFTIENNEIIFDKTDIYSIFIKINTVGVTTVTFGTSEFKVQKSTQGGAYADVTATNCFIQNDSVLLSSFGGAGINYIENATAGDKIKIVGRINSGRLANNTATVANQCEIIVTRLKIDGINDNSAYLNSYNTTNKLQTVGTYTDTIFDSNRYIDSSVFAHTTSTAIFTVNTTGIYLIIAKINISGTAKSYATSQIVSNISGSYVQVPGSIACTYVNDATNNDNSSCISVVVNLNAGNSIKLQSQSSVNTINLTSGTSMYMALLRSTTNNQNSVKFGSFYNTSAITYTTANIYYDLTFQGNNVTDTIYTNNTNSITLNETGNYLFIHRVTANNAGTNATRQDISQSKLVINPSGIGTLFTDLPSTTTNCFVGALTNYRSTSISFNTSYITSGSIIKLQVMKTLAASIMTTLTNGSSLVIIKLDNAPVLSTIAPVILNYGTYFQYAKNSVKALSTSTVFQEKLLLSTPQLPSGIYKIETNYQIISTGANTKDLNVITVVDGNIYIHDMVINYNSTQTQIISDYDFQYLSDGFHTISLQYKTVAGTNSGIYNAKLSIYKVSQ